MVKDPWTDPDPQPGDFDESLREIDAQLVEVGNQDGTLTRVVAISAEVAPYSTSWLPGAESRPGEVAAELLRDA